ncbi:FAD-containing monooxygenase EthA [Endozoicomonas sp. OPT23]|uniref:flavin-containing monooxygenase n=1 Tax=Endozoicomonas sp. OPT23 TaxID=2072845 RepID=UPI00129A7FA8|nr:NAD(P)/FAD-dependent oxidoreductase [Endozoicomonas sp. OPT23]MRI34174.1 FAD-containing monooxygenase EthA [Endozoicomonas sp. OPT23]
MSEVLDVLIIGAGISGVGMACRLKNQCPDLSFQILERRESLGGTWDLFKYPGVRSDSDMLTFGFDFNPWNGADVLASGSSIKQYISETAHKFQIENQITYGIKVIQANWSTIDSCWTVTAFNERTGQQCLYKSRFMVSASGYYNFDQGYLPDWQDIHKFKGQVIHPQHWPDRAQYKDKKVVVIGSGATAVTLIPSMADDTSHITMLQRSPSYVYSLPSRDQIAITLKQLLPEKWVYRLARARNIHLQRFVYKVSRQFPGLTRRFFLNKVRKQLTHIDSMQHFTPNYNPWDQRVAAVPDSDLFKAVNEGKASVVTDEIKNFNAHGIALKSGKQLDADIIIAATGLKLQAIGGMKLSIDGKPYDITKKMTYKAVLLQDLPNAAMLFGYTNSSWTLKIDLATDYVCRLLNEMTIRKAGSVIPTADDGQASSESVLDSLTAGYVKRGSATLPRQGKDFPWKVTHDYKKDKKILKQPISDSHLEWG